MAPVVNINTDIFIEAWDNVACVITDIGFDMAVMTTDFHSSNNPKTLKNPGSVLKMCTIVEVRLFNVLITHTCLKTFTKIDEPILVLDAPWLTVKWWRSQRRKLIKKPHEIEKGRSEKSGFKLNEKVLHPHVMEKTNVKLADSVIHECTNNALAYYAEHGCEHFKDLAAYAKVIRKWFNIVNTNNTNYGTRKRDEERCTIRRGTVNQGFTYIASFVVLYGKWKRSGLPGLSKPTFEAAVRTCKAAISPVQCLCDYCDFLERRFGWWRRICGENYYNFVI